MEITVLVVMIVGISLSEIIKPESEITGHRLNIFFFFFDMEIRNISRYFLNWYMKFNFQVLLSIMEALAA